MHKKILITGVAGFIGSNLAQRLINENRNRNSNDFFDVTGIDNLSYGLKANIPDEVKFLHLDIRSKKIQSYFKGIDIVFHLAAKNCINDCQINPVETADINVAGSVNVFEASKYAKVEKIVLAESSALYEGIKTFPSPEIKIKPKSFYAVSKLSSRHFANAFSEFFDMNFTSLRYFCVYGPVQDYRRTIPPIISAFIIKLLKGENPIIYGTGRKKRDFIYVDDVNDFHLKCIHDSRTDHETFNLGSGTNYSVLEIYKLVSDLLGVKKDPIFKSDIPGEAEITLADISKANQLHWKPKTDIKTGVSRAIKYIKNEMTAGRIP